MLTWNDVWSLARTLLRWWPVLIVSALLSSGTAWYLSREQPDYYQAHATLSVGNNFMVSAPNVFAVEVSNSLARYYEVLLRREVILQPTVDQLQLELSWRAVSGMLGTEVNPRANLLEIYVTDSSPERAAAIANTIGEQLIAYSPNAPEKVAAEQSEIERQIQEAESSLNTLEQRINDLRQRQQSLTAAIDLRENQEQISELESVRAQTQENYNQLLGLRNSSSANTLSFFERASVPRSALPQKTKLVIGGAGLGGLLVAAVAVFLLNLLDNRWRHGDDLQRRVGIRNLGRVGFPPPRRYEDDGGYDGQIWHRAVRETHTRLVLAAADQQPRMLLVSSPEPSASRSNYTLSLASIYGQTGHRVLLVDAELAQPYITALVADQETASVPSTATAIERWRKRNHPPIHVPQELLIRLRPTNMANVALLPSRKSDDDQPLLVPMLHWPELVDGLRHVADVVIFDGPSLLTSADAALLAPLVDAVVLVLDRDRDTLAAIAESRARLERNPQSRLLGAVTITDERRPLARPRRRSPGSRFSVKVGRDGVTITLPGKRVAAQQPALEDREAQMSRAVGEPAGAAAERNNREHVDQDRTEQPASVLIKDLIRRSEENKARAEGTPAERVIITPPPGQATTPRRRSGRGPAGRRRFHAGQSESGSKATEE